MLQVSLRILDIFFYEGHKTTFLFKVALSVLKMHQDEILDQQDCIHICQQIKQLPIDCETLLKVPLLLFLFLLLQELIIITIHRSR